MPAASKWYQNPKIAVPVLVALIGLISTIATLEPWKDDSPPPTPTPVPTPSPTPEPVLSFPVVVIDDVTGDPIPGAAVMTDEQGGATETDSQGRCTLSVRPRQSKLRITVRRDGYDTRNVELTVFDGMDPVRIRLQKKI